MRRFILGLVVAGSLAGCSTPLPILGVALDGKVDVLIEAKVIKNSGEVVPVADTEFSYTSSLGSAHKGTFRTDFDGKGTIRVREGGTIYFTGYYSLNDGSSVARWDGVPVHNVSRSTGTIRLSNSNAAITND